MIVLLVFAVLAGAGTALSPCVLPVLPALLSAGGVGGRRRPLGIVLGLSLTFTVTIVGLAKRRRRRRPRQRPAARPLDRGAARVRRSLLAPALGAASRRRCRGSRASARAHAATASRRACWSAARSASSTPLRRPDPRGGDLRQRGERTHGAAGARLRGRLGASCCSLLALGGRQRLRPRAPGRPGPRAAAGARRGDDRDGGADRYQPRRQLRPVHRRAHPRRQPHRGARVLPHRHEPPAADHRPPGPVRARQRSSALGRSAVRRRQRARPRARPPCWPTRARCRRSARRPNSPAPSAGSTPPASEPLSLASLRGRVVLVDFWTYTCINCIRTLPYLKAWDADYRRRWPDDRRRPDAGVRLRARRRQRRGRDQAVRDPLPGRPGQRHGHLERLRQRVLAGRLPDRRPGPGALRDRSARATTPRPKPRSARCWRQPGHRSARHEPRPPEWSRPPARPRRRPTSAPTAPKAGSQGPFAGLHDYGPPPSGQLALNTFVYSGTWRIAAQPAEAVSDAGIDVGFQAKNVYLVLELRRRTAAAGDRCCSTATRSPPPTPAPTSTTAW